MYGNVGARDLRGVYHRTWWALMLRGVLGLAVGIYIFVDHSIPSPHSPW